MTADVSKTVLNLKQNGEINQPEERILSMNGSASSTEEVDDQSLGIAHFSGTLIVSSVISAIVLFIKIVCVIGKRLSIRNFIQSSVTLRRIYG